VTTLDCFVADAPRNDVQPTPAEPFRRGRWRKRKGIAKVKLSDGSIHTAELHWYEASGIGRKEFKIKRLL
jgi:hypothetical protein